MNPKFSFTFNMSIVNMICLCFEYDFFCLEYETEKIWNFIDATRGNVLFII